MAQITQRHQRRGRLKAHTNLRLGRPQHGITSLHHSRTRPPRHLQRVGGVGTAESEATHLPADTTAAAPLLNQADEARSQLVCLKSRLQRQRRLTCGVRRRLSRFIPKRRRLGDIQEVMKTTNTVGTGKEVEQCYLHRQASTEKDMNNATKSTKNGWNGANKQQSRMRRINVIDLLWKLQG